jgi:trk system potassium uptake protein TrkH
VSAYCNAGFSLYHANLVPFAGSWSVSITIMVLIVVGGIGFPVCFEALDRAVRRLRRQRPDRISLHTRAVVWATGLLIAGGAVPYLLLEWNRSMRGLGFGSRILTALFQSVTTRTAGFNTLDYGAMAPATLLVTCGLMFIGGSPGSTAGGIKTTTLATLLATFRAELRRRDQVTLMGRAIPLVLQRRALGVGLLGVVAVGSFSFLLLLTEKQEPLRLVFEVVSALGTVGLSTGITPDLSVAGKLLVALAMLVGRLGPLTVMLALADRTTPSHTALPEERLGIG